jgi:hypothetical protein
VEASSEGCGSGRHPLLLGLIGISVSGRSRLVASLSGTAFLWRLVAPDLGVERSGEPCGVTVGFIGWSRGMGGVLAPVGEVGELWKTKNGDGRTSGGERDGTISFFVPTGWWEAAILGRGATVVVTNECQFDSPCGMSREH